MPTGITRSLLIQEADRRGFAWREIGPNRRLLQVTVPDGRVELFSGSCPTRTARIGSVITKNKQLTLDFVQDLGFQVPPSMLYDDEQSAQAFLEREGTLAVKPLDSERSQGVTVGVTTVGALQTAVVHARTASPSNRVILQRQLSGNLYRVVIIDGQLAAAAWRRAATVVGDGQQTVEQLTAALNDDPRRGTGGDSPLKIIDLQAVRDFVGSEGLSTVPPAGERVTISAIDSVSAGGDSVDITAAVHPDWRRVCSQIANAAHLFIAGFDLLCPDITQPMDGTYLPLLEINSEPGFKIHEYPTGGGMPVHLATILFDALFPNPS